MNCVSHLLALKFGKGPQPKYRYLVLRRKAWGGPEGPAQTLKHAFFICDDPTISESLFGSLELLTKNRAR